MVKNHQNVEEVAGGEGVKVCAHTAAYRHAVNRSSAVTRKPKKDEKETF